MKSINIFFILILGFAIHSEAGGPLFKQKDTFTQQEFDNVYQDISSVRNSTSQINTILSATNTWTATQNFSNITSSYVVVGGTLNVNGSAVFNSSTSIKGTVTNDSAATGFVGEYISSITAQLVSAVANNTYFDPVSLTLTPGDWDVTGQFTWSLQANTVNLVLGGISTTAGNSGTGLSGGVNVAQLLPPTSAADSSGCIANYRISINSTTTVYFKAYASYTSTAPRIGCRISARRMR